MTRRGMLRGALGLAAGWILGGCDNREDTPPPSGVDAGAILKAIKQSRDMARRPGMAQTLADLSPEDLKPIKADLEKAVAAERDANIKDYLRKALDKAQ